MGFNSVFKRLKVIDRSRFKHKLAVVFILYAVCRHTSVSVFVVRRDLEQMKRAKGVVSWIIMLDFIPLF